MILATRRVRVKGADRSLVSRKISLPGIGFCRDNGTTQGDVGAGENHLMKRGLTILVLVLAVLAGGVVAPVRGDDKTDKKSPLPGKAKWDLRALTTAFNVIDTQYDEKNQEVKWVVETKETARTADFVRDLDHDRPFTFTFLDGEMNELAQVQLDSTKFQGIPKDKLMKKGTRLDVVLELPEAVNKARAVTVRRGKPE
jgi:hypothetical protein